MMSNPEINAVIRAHRALKAGIRQMEGIMGALGELTQPSDVETTKQMEDAVRDLEHMLVTSPSPET